MDADGDLAAAAQFSKGGAFCGDGEAGCGVVEEGDRGDGFGIVFAGLDAERALAGGGTEIPGVEPFSEPLGFFEAVKAGGGEQDGVDLAFIELAEAGVDIAAEFDCLNVGAEGFQLCAATLAAGADDGSLGEFGEAPEFYGDECVAWVNPGRRSGKGEWLGEFGGEVFEGVDGEVDASFGEGFFDFLGEHALGADLGEGDFLKAVAGGFNDFDIDFMALGDEEGLDVMGLPKGQLRTTASDTELHRRISRLAAVTESRSAFSDSE